MQRLVVACLSATLFCSANCDAALMIQGYSPLRHDRFYTGSDKAFIGEGLDFSGVGHVTASVSGGTLNRWATMITPEYFVSARHFHPAPGDTLTFWEGNEPSGPSHSYTVALDPGYTAAGPEGPSDVWMGRLSEAVPAADNIAYYAFSAFVMPQDYVGQDILVYGRDDRVGANQIDWIGPVTIWDSTSTATVTTVMRYDYDVPGDGDEARVQPGDSGGPSFMVSDGRLVLLGAHYYTVEGAMDNPSASVDSFIPDYGRQLVEVMGGPIHPMPVPEPGSLLLLVAMVPAILAPRRRATGG